ncbi:hypoxanthine phosphoribosyltransferase [Mesoaciditoga lauensis]|uniref:hypoxanthine phosphoribosyltransferase n=1 Tax=Mesoaciditoga lauensis TaxID=1495039 RepID=UPI000561D37E|nr:hypoxanthine phosphoribosyltransferase [Mesoaciditoga lauensis]
MHVLYTREQLQKRIKELGKEITDFYKPITNEIVAVCVLKGAVHFFSDLVLEVGLNVSYSFVQVSSYVGEGSTERVRVKSWLDESITGKHILVVEDIVDTGITLNYILKYFAKYDPASLKVVTLFEKHARRKVETPIDFSGFSIEDKFILGYGFDYDQKYRNMPYVGYIDA